MKQLFSAFTCLLILTGICRAQDSLHITTPKASTGKNQFYTPAINSKEYCLEKHSKLNTTAWVLLSAGVVMGVTGTIIYENAYHNDGWDQMGNVFGGSFLMIAGSALVITSVPIFIRSGYYKRKAMDLSASLKFEHYQSGLAMKSYPAIGLRISL
jgi:uncharacterized membrane protein